MKKGKTREHPLSRKARARAYKEYYMWLAHNKDIRKSLQIPVMKFKNII